MDGGNILRLVKSWRSGRCVEANAGDAQEHWREQVSQCEGAEPGKRSGPADR